MSTPTNILGKVGQKVGQEIKAINDDLEANYATKVSLGNVVSTIDFSPYATVVSLGTVNTNLGSRIDTLQGEVDLNSTQVSLATVKTSLGSRIDTLQGEADLKATQVSINNLRDGTDAFSLLSATRAEIGDLTVTGTTTTLNTQTVVVEDNIIEVNLQSDGSETAQTGGLQVNRGGGTQSTVTETYLTGYSNLQVTKDASNNVTAVSWDYGGSTNTYSVPSGHTSFPFDYHLGNMADPSDYTDGAGSNFNFGGTFGSDGQGGSTNTSPLQYIEQVVLSGHGGVNRFVTFTHSSGSSANDKATIIWDDNTGQSMWKFGLGSTDADIKVGDVEASGIVKVSDGTSLTINGVEVGDYSLFESALNTAKA